MYAPTIKLPGLSVHPARLSCKLTCRKPGAPWRRKLAPVGSYGPLAPKTEPSQEFDDLVLDEKYYEELGMTWEDVRKEQYEMLTDLDPDAVVDDEYLRGVFPNGDLPEDWQQRVAGLSAFGPPVSTHGFT